MTQPTRGGFWNTMTRLKIGLAEVILMAVGLILFIAAVPTRNFAISYCSGAIMLAAAATTIMRDWAERLAAAEDLKVKKAKENSNG